MTKELQLTLHVSRRFGWWLKGRTANDRLFMWTWWPTKGIAEAVARLVARIARRPFGREVSISERSEAGPTVRP